jgi:hypothetical protein
VISDADKLRRRFVVLAAFAVCSAGLAAGALGAGAAPRVGGSPCGPDGAAGVVDSIDDGIAHQIYAQELNSKEVSADSYRITSSSALASAVASGNRSQIKRVTHAIVYTPVWHIVRLRILSPSGAVLADVGGPYILAPVTGQITNNGKTVGSFVMSVQDDKGYKKLVNHITGAGVELYLGGKPLMGTLKSPPARPPGSGHLRLGGVSYDVDSYSVGAFPSGMLRVAVLVPKPAAALDGISCAQVRLATDAGIVRNVATGLMVSGHNIYANLALFISQAYQYTHVPVFVFDDGIEEYGTDSLLSAPPAPASLTPHSTTISYDRSRWLVSAQRPFPPEWIYVLAPAGPIVASGASGPSGASGQTAGQ